MTQIKLYGYATSPYVRKTGCFLYYKGLDFEHVPVNPSDPKATIGHTNGTQVPVLEIDGEYRRESSDHALWLDELFPEKPLCPKAHRDKILELDRWVTNTIMLSGFRISIDGEFDLAFRQRSWRLAALVSAHTPLSEERRNMWPVLMRKAPFIQEMRKHIDLTERAEDMQARIRSELVAHIGNGPFMGEMEYPTMLDLAVFPRLVFEYMFGIEATISAAETHPEIKGWMKRVAAHLPDNPMLAPDFMQINTIADGLA